MLRELQCAAVVPCLNEARTIGALVGDIRRFLPVVIVVDDGSSDATAASASAAGARVLRHERAGGKGAALRAGLSLAVELGFSHALTLDGDGQHSPADIPAFLASAQTTDSPLIMGNRMASPVGMPRVRRFVNRWMSRRLSTLTGRELPDSQCGFRLVRLAEWAELEFQTAHFEFESEMLCAFAAAGHRIEFIPIEVIYRDESSKIHPWRDTIRWLRWYWKQGQRFNSSKAAAAPAPGRRPRPV